jgi:hypothetical protein
VIADLGVNFVERQVLLAGFTADRSVNDYGIDTMMKTFSSSGEVEPGHVLIQVKATDHFTTHADGRTLPFRVEVADLKAWALEREPVALVVYDATADRAFWLDVKEYVRTEKIDEDAGGATVTLRVPVANVFDGAAVRWWRERLQGVAPRQA